MEPKELLLGVPIADKDGNPTVELIEAFQRLVDIARDLEARLAALE